MGNTNKVAKVATKASQGNVAISVFYRTSSRCFSVHVVSVFEHVSEVVVVLGEVVVEVVEVVEVGACVRLPG